MTEPAAVAENRLVDRNLSLDALVRRNCPNFSYYLFEDGCQRRIIVTFHDEASSKAASRQIKDVIDQAERSRKAIFHFGEDTLLFFAELLTSPQHPDASRASGERVAKIMSKNGNKLLANDRSFALRFGFALSLDPGLEQAAFVSAPVNCLEQGQTGENVSSFAVTFLGGVCDSRDFLSVGCEQI